MRRAAVGLLVLLAAWLAFGISSAGATPARIIILRHGEKATSTTLCSVGVKRSLALVQQYLGKGAKDSLFASEDPPTAFFSLTLHSLELVSPAAASWNLPVVDYSVVPLPGANKIDEERVRTQQAVNDVLTNPAYDGKVVVMSWEHTFIANKKLAESGNVTLRQLLHLDELTRKAAVPETWENSNYDYFWIVDYPAGSTIPSSFERQRQQFTGPYSSLPSNLWSKPEKLPSNTGCKS